MIYKMLLIQFVLSVNLIQMRLTKVGYTKKKHFDPRISTLFGIKIDGSDEYENASDSIRVKREFDSNVIY
jgi:hypothetical protein